MGWDNYVFDLQHSYPLTVEPFDLVFKVWNLDDAYAHTVFIGVLFEEGIVDSYSSELYELLRGL